MTKKLDDITLSQVRRSLTDSLFIASYRKLITDQPLDEHELTHLLRLGVIFLNSKDKSVEKLGYSLILRYSNRYSDYEPLYDISLSRDYMPIIGFIEAKQNRDISTDNTFSNEYLSSYKENFRVNNAGQYTYRSRGQLTLSQFAKTNGNIAVVAPTSYGKSEMLIEKVKVNLDQKICILVPTKALLAQTKRLLLSDPEIKRARPHIITHPDMYRDANSLVAVLTQERLLRLLKKNPAALIDRILVDEAHNILGDDERAQLLAQVLLISQRRNESMDISFFTPFLADTNSVDVINRNVETRGKTVEEFMKIEKLYYTRLGTKKLFLYDQFLNLSFKASDLTTSDELEFVINHKASKNIVYLNRPQQVERSALKIADQRDIVISDRITIAAEAVGKLIHPEYNIIECMQRGILYHHGGLPEVIRSYVEDLFSKYEEFDFLLTTSTLLEGVNTPAEKMFILNPYKGRSHLTPSQFKNLIGRICRFREVFDPETGDLNMLEPKIYVLDGSSSAANFSPLSFYQKLASSSIVIKDKVENPLLTHSPRSAKTDEALQYLENVEPGSSGLTTFSLAETAIGRLCYSNSIHDFDILRSETVINHNLLQFNSVNPLKISNALKLVEAICRIFFTDVDLSRNESLQRLYTYPGAQRFYGMFIEWRTQGRSYGEMIARFLHHWSGLGNQTIYIGTKWGDEGFMNSMVDLNSKSHTQKVNLAVAKIKEDQDFIEFKLMSYVEILNDLKLIEVNFYDQVKFGTSDKNMICMLKNGFSFELSKLLVTSYLDLLDLDIENDLATYGPELIAELEENMANEVLIFEASSYL